MYLLSLALVPLAGPLKQLLAGALIALFVQVAKKVETIPLQDGNKTQIRVVVGVLSFVVSALTALANGDLSQMDVSGMASIAADAAVTALMAFGSWAVARK